MRERGVFAVLLASVGVLAEHWSAPSRSASARSSLAGSALTDHHERQALEDVRRVLPTQPDSANRSDESAPLPEVDPGIDQPIGGSGGIDHFGIRVADVAAFDQVPEAVVAAGATVISQGEVMGAPTVFIEDLDGYAIQVYVLPAKP